MASPVLKRPRRSRNFTNRLSSSHTPDVKQSNKNYEQSPLLCEENDDETEKRQRQQKKVLELQRKNMPSPLNSKHQNISSNLAGLTNSQVADHYKNCIKLSSENKITAKNAFGLHLIDYMSEMLQSRDEGMTNFQMASCTLDASTKIYAHRVDSVHADAYKMVGGLGQVNNKKSKGDNKAGGEDDDSEDSNEGKKKKKAIKKSKTIATNINTLNLKKLDERFEVDPLFKKMSATFDEGGVKSLLMNSLRSRDDTCELLLDSSSNMAVSDLVKLESSSHQVTLSDLKMLSGLVDHWEHHFRPTCLAKATVVALHFRGELGSVNWSSPICPQFSNFQFCNWDANTHDIFGNNQEKSDENAIGIKTSESHAFDMNAVPDPIEDENVDNFETMLDDGCFPDNDDDNEDDWNENDKTNAVIQPLRLHSIDTLAQILLDRPSDYSYFDTRLLSAWAGPNHWRVKPLSKANQEKGKKDIKKKEVRIDYDEDLDITKLFKRTKKSIKLEKKTLQQWNINRNTMPEDLHYDIHNLNQLFLKPSVKLRLTNHTSEVDDGVGQYNYNNANDLENFCPASQDSDDDCDIGDDGMDFGNENDVNDTMIPSTGDVTAFSNNLLQQPYKVAKIDINYARTAKKVNVQKLKFKMWSIMTTSCDESNKENVGGNETIPSKMEGEIKFSNLYKILPQKVPSSTAENLSVPLTFVCFLHLVNEKCLKLIGDDMSDFLIVQDG
ncbi:Condensin complex subunit 2 [Nymphon striatum]|nr:Condensin complex subunit 2 [Nymphon striatum]